MLKTTLIVVAFVVVTALIGLLLTRRLVESSHEAGPQSARPRVVDHA